MAKFYVGQEVRIVRTANFPEMLGVDTRIVCWWDGGAWDGREFYSGWELALQTPMGCPYVARPDDIEPILDTKHEACDEDFKRDLDRLLEREGVL